MVGKEYRVIGIVVIENFVYIFVFFSFIPYYIDYANILYYYTKAILPYDFYHTFENFYFRRASIISLVSINTISIFALPILIEVESNTLNIFSRFYIRIIYEISIFTLLVIILILVLLSSLIISNYDDVVFYSLNSDEFNRFRFLLVRVR